MTTLAVFDIIARFLHLLGVLVWMGHNYANVIQRPRFDYPDLVDREAVQGMFEAAMKREHATFRWASIVVLASGIYMLWYRDQLGDALSLSGAHAVIGIGVWLGIMMVLNLWLVLWPHQKKVLGFVYATTEERWRCSRITFLSSRTNTILSFPALFFMLTGSHGVYLFS